jgi:hypothetical protein
MESARKKFNFSTLTLLYAKALKLGAVLLICAALILNACTLLSPLDDEEARRILTELLPRAQELDVIFWGEGLMPEGGFIGDDDRPNVSKYVAVDASAAYHTIKELQDAAESVFTYDYLVSVFEMAFVGTEETFSRYGETTDGRLTVNLAFRPFTLHTTMDASKARVYMGSADRVKLKVPAKVDGKDYGDITLDLVLQDGAWLLDSPTY